MPGFTHDKNFKTSNTIKTYKIMANKDHSCFKAVLQASGTEKIKKESKSWVEGNV